VKKIDPELGIVLALTSPEREFYLPPGLSNLRQVGPGAYRERSTGQVVEHADYATVWEARLEAGIPSDTLEWSRGMTWGRPLAFAFPGEHWVRESDK
jgi:hypothetical protein